MTPPADTFLDAVWDDDLPAMTAFLRAKPELGSDPDVMCHVVQLGSTEAVALMVENGAPLVVQSDTGFPLLHLAIDRPRMPLPGKPHRNHGVLKLLLAAGADVNERGMNDWTPLHRAAAIGDLEACRILLAHGADRTATTGIDNYATPEEEARHLGQHATAELIRDFKPGR